MCSCDSSAGERVGKIRLTQRSLVLQRVWWLRSLSCPMEARDGSPIGATFVPWIGTNLAEALRMNDKRDMAQAPPCTSTILGR